LQETECSLIPGAVPFFKCSLSQLEERAIKWTRLTRRDRPARDFDGDAISSSEPHGRRFRRPSRGRRAAEQPFGHLVLPNCVSPTMSDGFRSRKPEVRR
jgi:hypothetical protein